MKLDLTLEEVNLVLAALSRMPFEAVNQIIPKIQQQGQEQIAQEQPVTTEKENEDGTTV